jgi:hypothetical protein
MQTFLPYADFAASSIALDDRRLGKQRVETFQILRALTWPDYAWKNHPAVRMWRGFVPALVAYGLANCSEWVRRGYSDTVEDSLLAFSGAVRPAESELRRDGQLPPWFGLPALHLSHRSALMRKDPEYYRAQFGDVPDDLPYLWPADSFPRWPARRHRDAVPGLGAALDALGYAEARPGQADAVTATENGRDVLGCFAPRAGATSTGLLVGLARSGTTLWFSPHAGGGGLLPPGGLSAPEPKDRPAVLQTASTRGTAPDGSTSSTPPGKPASARPPSPVEIVAMRTEAEAVPDFRFHRPVDALDQQIRESLLRARPTRIVVDLGEEGSTGPNPAAAAAIRVLRSELADGDRLPLIVVGPAAAPERRKHLTEQFGLDRPSWVGGGFDPAHLLLGVLRVPDENRRRSVLAALLGIGPGPGLLAVPDTSGARRLTKGLLDRGARVAPLLRSGRPTTSNAAVAQWRRGTLQALVLPVDAPLPAERLGRKDARFVHLGFLPEHPRGLLDFLRAVPHRSAEPTPAVLVVTEAEAAHPGVAELAEFLGGRRCRRAALLDAVGEPVPTPCGRCDVCLQIPATELPLRASGAR